MTVCCMDVVDILVLAVETALCTACACVFNVVGVDFKGGDSGG